MFLKILIWLFSTSSFATDLGLDARYQISSSHVDTTGTGLTAHFSGESWDLSTGGRLYTGLTTLESFHYMGEAQYRPLSFLTFLTRLHHGYRFREPTSVTHLLFTARLLGKVWHTFSSFFEVGWYERFGRIDRGLPIPTFFSNPRREHDFAVRFGIGFQFTEKLGIETGVATFEEIEVENLNNPFVEAKLNYLWEDLGILSTYFRYKILLGFGRWDALTGGIRLTLPIGSDTPPMTL